MYQSGSLFLPGTFSLRRFVRKSAGCLRRSHMDTHADTIVRRQACFSDERLSEKVPEQKSEPDWYNFYFMPCTAWRNTSFITPARLLC